MRGGPLMWDFKPSPKVGRLATRVVAPEHTERRVGERGRELAEAKLAARTHQREVREGSAHVDADAIAHD